MLVVHRHAEILHHQTICIVQPFSFKTWMKLCCYHKLQTKLLNIIIRYLVSEPRLSKSKMRVWQACRFDNYRRCKDKAHASLPSIKFYLKNTLYFWRCLKFYCCYSGYTVCCFGMFILYSFENWKVLPVKQIIIKTDEFMGFHLLL